MFSIQINILVLKIPLINYEFLPSHTESDIFDVSLALQRNLSSLLFAP